jgi:hypothetical protein
MKINFNQQSFKANIPYTDGAKRLEMILNKVNIYDFNMYHKKFISYNNLCKRINKILPDDSDIVTFNTISNIDNTNNLVYEVNGSVTHDGKNKDFKTLIYCPDGSFGIAKNIIIAINNLMKG